MNHLDAFIARRRARIAVDFAGFDRIALEELASRGRPVRDFCGALQEGADVAVIAEIKKASPSAGPILPDCDVAQRVRCYERGGAAAISVLADPDHFEGSFEDVETAARAIELPVLCKDIVVSPAQLFAARGHGADSCIVMLRVLGDDIREYLDLAATLGMDLLVEVADMRELKVAVATGSRLIGVNARDFRTLKIDLRVQREIVAEAARSGATIVAASGITRRSDVEAAASAGADAVLVGETLMRAADPESALRELVGVGKEWSDV